MTEIPLLIETNKPLPELPGPIYGNLQELIPQVIPDLSPEHSVITATSAYQDYSLGELQGFLADQTGFSLPEQLIRTLRWGRLRWRLVSLYSLPLLFRSVAATPATLLIKRYLRDGLVKSSDIAIASVTKDSAGHKRVLAINYGGGGGWANRVNVSERFPGSALAPVSDRSLRLFWLATTPIPTLPSYPDQTAGIITRRMVDQTARTGRHRHYRALDFDLRDNIYIPETFVEASALGYSIEVEGETLTVGLNIHSDITPHSWSLTTSRSLEKS